MRKPLEILTGFTFEPRLRIFAGQELVLGNGKILLLRLIQETGSISEAARRMQVSYNHAWTLLQVMNRSFKEPLVEAARGGSGKGGATITKAGATVLSLYAEMAEDCRKAATPKWKSLMKMLAPPLAASGQENDRGSP